jgi:hypothetical protein
VDRANYRIDDVRVGSRRRATDTRELCTQKGLPGACFS